MRVVIPPTERHLRSVAGSAADAGRLDAKRRWLTEHTRRPSWDWAVYAEAYREAYRVASATARGWGVEGRVQR